MSNSSAKLYGGAVSTEMSNSLRLFEGRAASADEVASLFMAMQSLPMPRRPSASVTGLFVWPGEGVQMRCDQSTLTTVL